MKILLFLLLNLASSSIIKAKNDHPMPESKKMTIELKNDGGVSTVQADHQIKFGKKTYSHVADLSTIPESELTTK